MLVGDVVNKYSPSFGVDYQYPDRPKTLPGRVVYIHPKRRFFVLQFDFDHGRSFCQSFSFHGDR